MDKKTFSQYSNDWCNLATVVNYNSGYWVFLVVHDPEKTNNSGQINWNRKVLVFPSQHNSTKWGEHSRQQHSSLSGAQSEASWLRGVLNNDNPILYVHPEVNSYCCFSSLITSPYVKKEEVGSSFCYSMDFVITIGSYQVPSNLNDYFKPLDIIKVKKVNSIVNKTYLHVGVYLGKNAICHISDPNGLISEENLQARITSWDIFLNGWLGTQISGRVGELIRYHPIIPFKHYERIAKQIAWGENMQWREGEYCLAGQNCEHASNMIIHGIEYSQQVAERSELAEFFNRKYTANKNKSSSFVLGNEINSTNNQLGERDDQRARDIRDQYKAQVEISTKDGCKIM